MITRKRKRTSFFPPPNLSLFTVSSAATVYLFGAILQAVLLFMPLFWINFCSESQPMSSKDCTPPEASIRFNSKFPSALFCWSWCLEGSYPHVFEDFPSIFSKVLKVAPPSHSIVVDCISVCSFAEAMQEENEKGLRCFPAATCASIQQGPRSGRKKGNRSQKVCLEGMTPHYGSV